jgi:hypothetical protein
MTDENKQQVGGQHYKKLAIQPWDYVLANNLGYMEGSVIKYITRWRDKHKDDPLEDLYKCRHFLNKLIEHQEKQQKEGTINV